MIVVFILYVYLCFFDSSGNVPLQLRCSAEVITSKAALLPYLHKSAATKTLNPGTDRRGSSLSWCTCFAPHFFTPVPTDSSDGPPISPVAFIHTYTRKICTPFLKVFSWDILYPAVSHWYIRVCPSPAVSQLPHLPIWSQVKDEVSRPLCMFAANVQNQTNLVTAV